MSIARQSFIITSLNWLLLPLSILISVLIARTVGPEGVGILALLTAAVGVLSSVGSFGLTDSFIYYYKKKVYPLGQILTIKLFAAIVFSLVVFLVLVLFSEHFFKIIFHGLKNYEINSIWIYLAFFVIPLGLIFEVFNLILIVDNKMGLYTISLTGATLARLTFLSLLVFIFEFGITGVLLSQLLVYIVPMVISGIWLKKSESNIKWEFSKKAFLNLFRTGRRQYGISLLALIPKRFDVFLIGMFLAVKFNGYYAIAFGLMNLLYNIPRSTMWPLVGNLTCKDGNERGETIARTIRIELFFMSIVAIIIFSSAYYLIYYFYGEKFLLSVSTVRVLLVGSIASAINIPGAAYYNSIGQPGRILPYASIAMIFHAILDIILIPLIGIIGAAVAFSSSQIFVSIVFILLLAKHTDIPIKRFLFFTKEDARLIYKLIERKVRIFRKGQIQISSS